MPRSAVRDGRLRRSARIAQRVVQLRLGPVDGEVSGSISAFVVCKAYLLDFHYAGKNTFNFWFIPMFLSKIYF